MKEPLYRQQCLQKENEKEISETVQSVMRKIRSQFFFKNMEMVMTPLVIKMSWFRGGLMLEHIWR